MSEGKTVDETRLGFDQGAKTFLYVVGAIVGAALGAALPYIAGWVADLEWVPFQGPLQFLASFDQARVVWVRPAVGVLIGLAFAAAIIHHSPVVRVGDDTITVVERGSVRKIPREKVEGVYRDGRQIVIETAEGRQLFRGEIEGSREVVRDAFLTRGYPWESE